MDDNAVDAVVEGNIIFEGEIASVVEVTGQVDTLSIDNRVHVPLTIVGYS